MTSLYSFRPVNSLLLGIFEGFTRTTSSPSLVLVPKHEVKAILRLYLHEIFLKRVLSNLELEVT